MDPLYLVRLAGIEPTTPWFVAKYSIQLSYSREACDYSPEIGSYPGGPAVADLQKRSMLRFVNQEGLDTLTLSIRRGRSSDIVNITLIVSLKRPQPSRPRPAQAQRRPSANNASSRCSNA